MTPTERALGILRKRRGLAFGVERWVPMPDAPGKGFRRDFAGIADVVFYGDDGSVLFVQVCTTDISAHRRKLLGDWTAHAKGLSSKDEAKGRKAAARVLANVCRFLRQGRQIEIWSISLRNQGRRGAAKKPTLRIVPITLEEALAAAQKDGELPFTGESPEFEESEIAEASA